MMNLVLAQKLQQIRIIPATQRISIYNELIRYLSTNQLWTDGLQGEQLSSSSKAQFPDVPTVFVVQALHDAHACMQ